MEYFRDKDGQIQADIAYRLGRIILQYESFSIPSEQKFESTLYLSVLQNILTNCIELLNSLSDREKKSNQIVNSSIESENIFGFKSSQIRGNTFFETLTCDKIIRHIRNALSHPTKINIESEFCSTGYSTLKNQTNTISEYCFISSPDTKYNRLKNYSKIKAEVILKQEHNLPDETKIMEANDGGFNFRVNGKPFGRIFKIVLSTSELRKLTIGLCTYLAQPIQENWDGITIKIDLLAA